MRPRRDVLGALDRVALTVLALLLVAVGVVLLTAGSGRSALPTPSQAWERAVGVVGGWNTTVVVAVAAVVAILAGLLAIRHLLPARRAVPVSQLRLPSGNGQVVPVRASAVARVFAQDVARSTSVTSADAVLVRADPPLFELTVDVPVDADLIEVRDQVAQAVTRVQQALGGPACRVRLRVRFAAGASAARVV